MKCFVKNGLNISFHYTYELTFLVTVFKLFDVMVVLTSFAHIFGHIFNQLLDLENFSLRKLVLSSVPLTSC